MKGKKKKQLWKTNFVLRWMDLALNYWIDIKEKEIIIHDNRKYKQLVTHNG